MFFQLNHETQNFGFSEVDKSLQKLRRGCYCREYSHNLFFFDLTRNPGATYGRTIPMHCFSIELYISDFAG